MTVQTALVPGVAWPCYVPNYVQTRNRNGTKPALSARQVNEIRLARANKVSYSALEAKYKLGRRVISDAVYGRRAYAP
jgi:hypothetical protein